MEELVLIVDENRQSPSDAGEKKIEDHKRLISECNEKFEAYQEELLDLPDKIDAVNHELMVFTMDYCYDSMQENTREIVEIAKWITEVRIELKKNLIRKQEKEIYNHQMYAYLHDIFGPEVIELFDLKYDPSKQVPKKKPAKESKEKDKKIKKLEDELTGRKKLCDLRYDKLKQAHQEKIEFAVKQLRLLKSQIIEKRRLYTGKFSEFSNGINNALYDVEEDIDNLVEELKQEME